MQRRFEIGHCLGKGGFGEVYRAVAHGSGGLEHEVAIKLLHPDLLHNEMARDRMRDEGRLLSRLNHPAIVTCYALTVIAGRIALVTEFVHGADLSVCCQMKSPIPHRALLQVLGKMGAALDLAYNTELLDGRRMELIHRDIKPGNIRVGVHGQAFLLDFGIARSDTMERNTQTAADLAVGSLLYMAPERFGPTGAGTASDVFGLGCCLYEGLVGTPFYGASSLRDISRLSNESEHFERFLQQRMTEVPETVPQSIQDLCRRCLQHDPSHRPSAAQLSAECEQLSDELGGPNLRTWARAQQWPERPGSSASLTGQTLEEHPLPAPGETLQTLLPDLQINEGPAQTTAYVSLTEQETWNDEDGVLLADVAPLETPRGPLESSRVPRVFASAMSVLAVCALLGGLGAFSMALLQRWSVDVSDEVPTIETVTFQNQPQAGIVIEEQDEVPARIPEKVVSAKEVRKPQRTKKRTPTPVETPTIENGDTVIPTKEPARMGLSDVTNSGSVPVEVRGKGKVYRLPAKVPFGSYWIWADRGDGFARSTQITLNPGDSASVICTLEKTRCSYRLE